jgi:hypothetical protein
METEMTSLLDPYALIRVVSLKAILDMVVASVPAPRVHTENADNCTWRPPSPRP